MNEDDEGRDENRGTLSPAAEVVRGPATRDDVVLTRLAEVANRHHDLAQRHAHAANEHAKAALLKAKGSGEALTEAKARVEHGEWTAWLEARFDATPQTARNYMRIARRWPELREAMAETNTAFSIRRAIGFLAEPSDDGEGEGERAAQGRLVEGEDRTARGMVEDAVDRLSGKERHRARRILRRFDVAETVRARVAGALAEMTTEERRLLYDACRKRVDAGDVATMAHRERTRLLLSGRRPTRGGADAVEEARPVLNLQALLRWCAAYRDQTERTAILDGLWVARSVDKIADDLLGVAGWMVELASILRGLSRPAGLPDPADVVDVGSAHPHSRVTSS